MRSLFFRIFVNFLVATVLVGGLLLVLALTADPNKVIIRSHDARLARLGKELVGAYEKGGSAALVAIDRRRDQDNKPPADLFGGSGDPLSGQPVPPRAQLLATKTAITGKPQAQKGRHGLPLLSMPLDNGYILVAEVPSPSPLNQFLDPYGLTLRLGAAFLVAGLISFLLARSLSAPVRMLRAATQKLASGDLSVRVGPSLGNRRDESAELGRDFDRMAERIGDLLASQRRLLRDISHELRSPLARLNVALELARRKPGADAQAPLDRMEREAGRLNDLIGELLTLAQLQSDSHEIRRVRVDLQSLVWEIVEDADFEAKIANRRVRIVQDEPLAVEGAPELLQRAIENVVRNGVQFTSDDSVVEVRLSRSEVVSGPVARISVRDYGPGVPEESLVKIFEPFYRVSDARDRQSGGTGIGLAITQRAVELHGGTVRAFNTPGGGMDVVLDLPVGEPSVPFVSKILGKQPKSA